MTTINGGDSRVSIPNRKQIQEIKKTLTGSSGSGSIEDEFIHTTLKDCNMNPNETSRRLKMIHDIKEIAGNKHTVDDVYTMLKDCNMDPNEAAQRLLYIDTFHEVKKKQDRRKSISNDTSEEYRQTRGNQWRGANGGRGTFYSSKVFDDAGGGRNSSSGKEYSATNRVERVLKPNFPALSGKENTVHVTKSAPKVNGTPALSNGSYLHKLAPELLTVRPPDVSSSVSEPVVASSQNTRYMCSVGTIKCEIIKTNGSKNTRSSAGSKIKADIIPVVAESADSDSKTQLKSDAVTENKPPQLSNGPLNMTLSERTNVPATDTPVVPEKESELKSSAPKLDVHSVSKVETELNLSAPKLDVHSVSEVESELNLSAPKPAMHSVHEVESELDISAPSEDVMLEKLTISSHRTVIFPDHIQVPENFKTQFTFGSLDTSPDDSETLSASESPQQNGEIATEPSLSNENVSATAQEVKNEDHPLRQLSENELNIEIVSKPSSSNENGSTAQDSESKDHSEHAVPSQEDNISSDAAVKHEERKLEAMPPFVGLQNPVLQTPRDYSYGFMPHMMAPHFVQLDSPELQNGSPLVASSIGQTPTTQPTVAPQSSIALSPPLFPYFRQPYPNYIPYNPYYQPIYYPPNAHFMNHGVFPQPPPTTMVKSPAPSQNKDGSNEEVTVSQANDNNIHHTLQQQLQGEDPQVWAHAGGREVPNFPPNYYYHLPPQAHPMAFSPFYHSSQAMTPSQPLVFHQSHSNGNLEQPSNQNTVLLNSQTT